MKDLQNFMFKGQELRVFEINGQFHFLGSQIATHLGYKDPQQAVSQHCKNPREAKDLFNPVNLTGLGLHPLTKLIPESDVYRLISKCTLPVADELDRLLYEEVLPSLRKTGKYELTPQPKELNEKATEIQVTAEAFESFHAIGTLAGFEGNELTLFCNKGAEKTTGINALELGEATKLKAEVQQALLIPTQIAERLGGWSARKVNKRLAELNLQVHASYTGKKGKKKKRWELTEQGKKYGIYIDQGIKHDDGKSIRSIQWYERILDLLEGQMLKMNENSKNRMGF